MTTRHARCWCGRPVPRRHAPHGVIDCAEHDDRGSAPAPAARCPITDVRSTRGAFPQVSPSPAVFRRRAGELFVAEPEQRPAAALGGHAGGMVRAAVRVPGSSTLDVDGHPRHDPILTRTPPPAPPGAGDVADSCPTCAGDGFLFHLFEGAVELDGPCPTCQERAA